METNELDQLQIKRFDITCMAPDATICCIGKRRLGKSELVRDIMFHYKEIPRGVVFSGTEHCSPFFRNFIPDMYIFKEYDPVILENIFRKQDEIIKRDLGKNSKNNMFIIMDDMLADASNWKKDRQIRELLMNGRHYNVFYILTMQFPLGIPPDLRTNIDYVFIFKENILNNRRRIWENFAGVIPKFQTFQKIMDSCTEDYECLVINNNSKSNRLEDCIFFYKADIDSPNFQCGNKSFWKFHDKNYKKISADSENLQKENITKQYDKKNSFKFILE